MNCPKCNSTDIHIMVTMIVTMPADMLHGVTKTKMRRKEFQVYDVKWNTSSAICEKCGHVLWERKEKTNE